MAIICGTDLSANATQAAHAAAALARRLRMPLALVHAIDELGAELAFASGDTALYDGVRAEVEALAHRLRERYGTTIEPVVLPGSPDDAIVTAAQQRQAVLIVVGAIGRSGRTNWPLGSEAERIAHASPIPILIVRESASLESWASGERPLGVMVGVEQTPTSKAALRWAEQLAAMGGVALTVTRIVNLAAERSRLGLKAAENCDDLPQEIEAALTRDLRAWIGESAERYQPRLRLCAADRGYDIQLAAIAAEEHADLLVVGTHRRAGLARLWLGSVSRGVIERATVNVLVVPPEAGAAQGTSVPAIRSVLVPTDFSDDANRALSWAHALVGAGGTVHLIHVVAGQREASDEELRARLQALVPSDGPWLGVDTTVDVVEDTSAAQGILHAAARTGVDLICMATHGRSPAGQMLLGSQAAAVIRQAERPVVLVPVAPA